MLGIGFTEMIVIAGIALVVMGPEKFPEFAKMAVKMIREVRGWMEEAQREISKELRPIERDFQKLTRLDPDTYAPKPPPPVSEVAKIATTSYDAAGANTDRAASTANAGDKPSNDAVPYDAAVEAENPEPQSGPIDFDFDTAYDSADDRREPWRHPATDAYAGESAPADPPMPPSPNAEDAPAPVDARPENSD